MYISWIIWTYFRICWLQSNTYTKKQSIMILLEVTKDVTLNIFINYKFLSSTLTKVDGKKIITENDGIIDSI